MDLHSIANRIIGRHHESFGGVRGWLYLDGNKFADLMDRDTFMHQEFARKHVLEDIGFDAFLEKHKDEWPDEVVTELEDAAASYIFKSIPGTQAQQIIDLLIEETPLTEEVREKYTKDPEKAYSEDYDAIRIWIMPTEFIADNYGWDRSSLLALQDFAMGEESALKPNMVIRSKDYKTGKEYSFSIEDLLAYTGRGKSPVASRMLRRIAARVAFFGPGSTRGWLYTDGKYVPLSQYNVNNHYEMARKHVLEDAGYEKFWETHQEPGVYALEEMKPSQSHYLWYTKDSVPEFVKEFIAQTPFTQEILDRYEENPEKAYSEDYDAIRIWIQKDNTLTTAFANWNSAALRALRGFLDEHPEVQEVEFEDYTTKEYGRHPVDDVLKWRGTSRIFSFDLARIAARIAFGGTRGWLFIDGAKFIPLSDLKVGYHFDFARRYWLKDIGVTDYVEEHQKDLGTDIAGAGLQALWLRKPDELPDQLYADTALEKDKLAEYQDNGNKVFEQDYNAIRVWEIKPAVFAVEYYGWDDRALKALQRFLKDEYAERVMVEDTKTNQTETHDGEKLLKYRNVRKLKV